MKGAPPAMSTRKTTESLYRVVRNCCTSGNCIKCITARRSDLTMKPFQTIEVIQLDNLTKEKADIVANNFRAYGARVERQPVPPGIVRGGDDGRI